MAPLKPHRCSFGCAIAAAAISVLSCSALLDTDSLSQGSKESGVKDASVDVSADLGRDIAQDRTVDYARIDQRIDALIPDLAIPDQATIDQFRVDLFFSDQILERRVDFPSLDFKDTDQSAKDLVQVETMADGPNVDQAPVADHGPTEGSHPEQALVDAPPMDSLQSDQTLDTTQQELRIQDYGAEH